MKKLLYTIITGILLIALFTAPVFADDFEPEEDAEFSEFEEQQEDEIPFDNDEALQKYIDDELLGGEELLGSRLILGDRLEHTNRLLYDALYENVLKIAAGEETDTIIIGDLTESEYADQRWYAEDLGLSSIGEFEDGTFVINPDFKAAFYEAIGYDMRSVMISLLRDCPYEMFWFGQTYSFSLPYRIYQRREDGVLYARLAESMTMKISVSPDYAVSGEAGDNTKSYTSEDGTQTFYYNGYKINSDKLNAVYNAVDNAKLIVQDCPQTNDYDRLYYYFETVTGLSAYNAAATHYYPGGYGDPWQIIYLFDGDPSTKVVCEGFSKGMQYLCDMTDFDSEEIYCCSVTGNLYNVKTQEDRGVHMWNIVRMDDGINYMIDATNSKPTDPWGFLAGYSSGTVKSGYVVDEHYRYVYSTNNVLSIFAEEELTLSDTAYTKSPPADVRAAINGSNVTVSWEQRPLASGARLYQSRDGNTYTLVADITDASEKTIEGLRPGGYYFKVCSYMKDMADGDHESEFCDPVPVYLFRTTPEFTQVQNTKSGVKLSWGLDPYADGYAIYKSTGRSAYHLAGKVSDALNWTDTEVLDGTVYRYVLCSYKVFGGKTWLGDFSKIRETGWVAGTEIQEVSSSILSMNVSWEKEADADGYILYRSEDGRIFEEAKAYKNNGVTSWTDPKAVTSGKKYSYRIASYKDVNGIRYFSAESDAVSAIRLARPILKVTGASEGGITLSWDKTDGAAGYELYRSTDGAAYEKIAAFSTGDAGAFTDTDASNTGVTYAYRLVAFRVDSGVRFESFRSVTKEAVLKYKD